MAELSSLAVDLSRLREVATGVVAWSSTRPSVVVCCVEKICRM